MKVISRYILMNNLMVMGICLVTCTGIYLLVDVFDRLDNFLNEGASLWAAGMYFGAKIPLIWSQILPAVVFLGFAIQINGMRKRRETTAMEAGGVPYARLVGFVLILGLFWSGGQLLFSQVLGVQGQRISNQIWDNLGRSSTSGSAVVSDAWVRSDTYIVHVDTFRPEQGRGTGVQVFDVGRKFQTLRQVLKADSVQRTDKGWKLIDVQSINPQDFTQQHRQSLILPGDLNFDLLPVSTESKDPEQMSLWALSSTIHRLQDAGTNVEMLRTIWHLKLSYAFSCLVLTAVALVLTRRWDNLFAVISAGLGVIFLLYALHALGGTLGESGALPPWLGAWLGNILVGGAAFPALAAQIQGRL